MPEIVERHRRACADFSRVAGRLGEAQWELPTPCEEWDARALVEHVIGFHDFLLLRPLGVRAHRPKTGPATRWEATSTALFTALDAPGAVDRETELPGGGTSSPAAMLGALTTDVLVHTWDLARAAGVDPQLDAALCAAAYDAARRAGVGAETEMVHAEVPVPADADTPTRLVALHGRDPAWRTSARGQLGAGVFADFLQRVGERRAEPAHGVGAEVADEAGTGAARLLERHLDRAGPRTRRSRRAR